jgi:hypothetical protein
MLVDVLLAVTDRTVEFDHEAKSRAAQVEHKRANRVLSSKLQSHELTVAETHPQNIFRPRFPFSQVTSSMDIVPRGLVRHSGTLQTRTPKNAFPSPGARERGQG